MNKNLISKLFTNRFFLIFLSSFIGMMLVNFLILFSLPFAKQKYNYPRNLLRYLPPLARWDYPDFEKSDSNINALIIGDSYAEGAGDSFLNNEYKYSIGHYLSEYTNFNYKLAANGGSDLLFQISFLEDSFRNNHSSLKNFKESIDVNDNLKIIAFFYEGNDLQSAIYENRMNDNSKIKKIKTFTKKSINRYFPLAYFFKVINYDLEKKFSASFDKKIINQESVDENKYNKICRNGKCRYSLRIQSAAPDLKDIEIDFGVDLTAKGLINFKEKYDAKICFFYIPSPATIYSPKQIFPQIYFPVNVKSILPIDNLKRSKYIRNSFKKTLLRNDIAFYDSTNFLISKSNNAFIHGEKDQKHFNQNGYKYLARFVSNNLEECFQKN